MNKSFLKNIKKIYGIGDNRIQQFLLYYGLNSRINSKYIKKNYSNEIKKKINTFLTERALKNNIKNNIIFLSDIKNYRGVRHKLKYPVRGQRTRTNAKTTKKKKL